MEMIFKILKDTGDGKGAERYFVFRILPDECLLTGYLGMWRKKPTRKQMIEAVGKKERLGTTDYYKIGIGKTRGKLRILQF